MGEFNSVSYGNFDLLMVVSTCMLLNLWMLGSNKLWLLVLLILLLLSI